MIQFTIRRLIASIPVLFGILAITFALARAVPGNPCKAILGEKATVESCDRFIKEKGLDQPITTQFGVYMRDVFTGDLGNSIKFGKPITDLMVERMPLTVELALSALVLALIVGIPLGVAAAVRRNSIVDVFTMVFANIGVSVPVFFLGLMLSYFFAITLKGTPFQLPPSGRLPAGMVPDPFFEVWGWTNNGTSFTDNVALFISNMVTVNALITGQFDVFVQSIRYMILPAVALSTIPMAIVARMTRSSMLEVLGLDYIRTARAKGLTQNAVIAKHAFRNALLPVVTVVGLQLGLLLGGAVLTESVFGLTGVGRTLYEGIIGRDYPVIQGFTLLIAGIFVAANLLVDLSYAYLNPRIRLS